MIGIRSQIRFPVAHDAGDGFEEHGNGHQGSQDIRDGFGKEHAVSAPDPGQQENGNEIHRFPPEAQGQRKLYLSHTRQAIDDGILDAQGDDGNGDDLDGPEGLRRNGRILGKQRNEQRAAGVSQDEQQGIISGAEHHNEPGCLLVRWILAIPELNTCLKNVLNVFLLLWYTHPSVNSLLE